MKMTALVSVACPRCGADPSDMEALRKLLVAANGTYRCSRCGRVSPMPQAVRLLDVVAGSEQASGRNAKPA